LAFKFSVINRRTNGCYLISSSALPYYTAASYCTPVVLAFSIPCIFTQRLNRSNITYHRKSQWTYR